MAPSTSLQSKIEAFEALSKVSRKPAPNPLEEPISPTARVFTPITPSAPPNLASRSPSPDPPNLGRKTSLIDLREWVVDDGPVSPTGPPRPQSTKPAGHGRAHHEHASHSAFPPLITLQSAPTKVRTAPPLPPRKASSSSVNSSFSDSNPGIIASSSATLHPSDSLSPTMHAYPPVSAPNRGTRGGHVPAASSISSFHSVSLSSDGGDGPQSPESVSTPTFEHSVSEADRESLDDFDHLSNTSAASYEYWPQNRRTAPEPPKIPHSRSPALPPRSPALPPRSPLPPQRSPMTSPPPITPPSPTSTPTLPYARRVPPPPPASRSRAASSRTSLASTSDRSSILSTASGTSTSRTSVSSVPSVLGKPGQPFSPSQKSTASPHQHHPAQLARPTPVPPPARRRYESVYEANVRAQRRRRRSEERAAALAKRKNRQAAGWRGLSVDLITSPELVAADADKDDSPEPLDQERLDGEVVRMIWEKSRLTNEKLKVIWNDCDPNKQGSLDRDAFVRGMWRIDEELRRAQVARQVELAGGGGAYRVRQPKRATPRFGP